MSECAAQYACCCATCAARAAELRGQVTLIERLLEQAQQPTLTGDPIGEPNA